jgi:hypothetical protein
MDRVRRLTRLRFPGRSPRSAGSGSAAPDGYASQAGTDGVHAGMPAHGQASGQAPAGYQADGPEVWAASSGRHRAAGRTEAGHTEAGRTEARRATGGDGATVSTVRAGQARARVRPAPAQEQGIPGPRAAAAAVAVPDAGARTVARSAAVGRSADAAGVVTPAPRRPVWRAAHASLRARLPFTAPHAQGRPAMGDGRRNCGSIEGLIWRQWDTGRPPPAQVVAAIDRLAELPERIKARLADGLDAIFIGPGGVPELDDMTALRGVALPSGHASWDACAGAYGERKIVVGSQPSPTPDVMCHEIGHALDDIDSPPGRWQSDSAEFRMLYDQCQSHFASDFHRQLGGLGRKEFFADAFAAIASGQRPALVDMLSGETRTALRVMLYFNRRYDI